MAERKSEAAWIESRDRWQINVQAEGVRKTFTSAIPGRAGRQMPSGRLKDGWTIIRLQSERASMHS